MALIRVLVLLLSISTGPAFSQNQLNYDYSNQGVNPNRGGRFNIGPIIPILRDEREGPIDGYYTFEFETGNGIRRQEQGSPTGPDGAVVSQGSWSFTFPDGTPAEFSFVADENGYRVDSPLLPTPPPMPAHALAQIEKAERERAAGIIHDGQYRPEDEQRFSQPRRRTQQQFTGSSSSASSNIRQQGQRLSSNRRSQNRFSQSSVPSQFQQPQQSAAYADQQFSQQSTNNQFRQSNGQFATHSGSSRNHFGSSHSRGQANSQQPFRSSNRRQQQPQQRFSEPRNQFQDFNQPQRNFGQSSRRYYK